MFNFILNLSTNQAVSCIHEAIRLIRHRLNIEYFDPLSEDEKLAWQIIEQIQENEGIRLKELSDSRAEAYIYELAGIGQDKTQKSLNYDPKRGHQLLKEIRKVDVQESSTVAQHALTKGVNDISSHETNDTLTKADESRSKNGEYKLTNREIENAFRLAYYIHPNRTVALKVTLDACDMFLTQKRILKRRPYVSNHPYRQRIPNPALLQMYIYHASDALERKQEQSQSNGEARYQVTHDDLIIRYIKFLIWNTLMRNPFYVAISLGCFLYTYRPSEIARLLDYNEDNSRRIKAWILQRIQNRFDVYQITKDHNVIMRPPNEYERMLVHNSLYMFTPWLPIEIIAPINKKMLLSTYFSPESEKTGWERSYILIDPVNAGLARLVREYNEILFNHFDEPENNLGIPVFRDVPLDNRDRFDLYSLRDYEIAPVQRLIEQKQQR